MSGSKLGRALRNDLWVHHVVDREVLRSGGNAFDDLLVKCKCDELWHRFVVLLVECLHLFEVTIVVALSTAQAAALVVERNSGYNDQVKSLSYVRNG